MTNIEMIDNYIGMLVEQDDRLPSPLTRRQNADIGVTAYQHQLFGGEAQPVIGPKSLWEISGWEDGTEYIAYDTATEYCEAAMKEAIESSDYEEAVIDWDVRAGEQEISGSAGYTLTLVAGSKEEAEAIAQELLSHYGYGSLDGYGEGEITDVVLLRNMG